MRRQGANRELEFDCRVSKENNFKNSTSSWKFLQENCLVFLFEFFPSETSQLIEYSPD